MSQTFGPDRTDPSNAIFMPREAGPGRMWPRDLPGHESGAADRACGGGWRVPCILGKPGPSGRSVAAADGRRGAEPRCWRGAGRSECRGAALLCGRREPGAQGRSQPRGRGCPRWRQTGCGLVESGLASLSWPSHRRARFWLWARCASACCEASFTSRATAITRPSSRGCRSFWPASTV